MADGNASDHTHPRRTHDPEAFDDDLEWLLVAGDSAMGARGTLGGVVAQLEHGGPFTGVPNTDLYSDQQVGFGKTVLGLVEKHRWLIGAWRALPLGTRGVLALCYHAPRAEHRADEQTRARADLALALGRYAALAFHLTDEPGQLLEACRQPSKGKNGRTITRATKAARDAAIGAHMLWSAAKGGAVKPRKQRERRSVLPKHVPHLPEAEAE